MGDPQKGPQAAPAMSPAQIVLAGGAGMDFDDLCSKVFQEFEPPIVCGTYSSVSKDRQKANKDAAERGTTSGYENNQSEHLVPNSSLQETRGKNGSNVVGAEAYTEGSAFSYSVYDDQSAGTEHKWLTDRAAKDAADLGPNPTLGDQLSKAKDRAREGLLAKLQREDNGERRDRIKDKPKKRSKEERQALAAIAAECLDQKARQSFEDKKISPNTQCRKGMKADGKGLADAAAAGSGM